LSYGGGGLTVGIASAVKALRPGTRIFTAEPATAAALAAAFAAGKPTDVDYQPSFVDGSGSRRVLDTMWPQVTPLVDDALSVPVAEVAAAVRPRRVRQGRLHRLGRQHQPEHAGRDVHRHPRLTRRHGITRASPPGRRSGGPPRPRCCSG